MQLGQTNGVPILTYHSIDDSDSVISVAPDVFREQMRFLNDNGCRVVSLENLIRDLNAKKAPAPKTVVLTFDDGFQNFYTTAFPVLAEYGFSATVFLVTDFCGKSNDWAGNPPALPRSRLMSWREIKDLSRHDISFGAHTRTHPDLTKIPFERAVREIAESKTEIENSLGTETAVFAYPYGKFCRRVKKIAEQNFEAACSVRLGKIRASADLHALARVDTFYLSNPRVFRALDSSAFDRYLQFRQALRDFKSKILNN